MQKESGRKRRPDAHALPSESGRRRDRSERRKSPRGSATLEKALAVRPAEVPVVKAEPRKKSAKLDLRPRESVAQPRRRHRHLPPSSSQDEVYRENVIVDIASDVSY